MNLLQALSRLPNEAAPMLRALLLLLVLTARAAGVALAGPQAEPADPPMVLTLDQAVEIALTSNYAVRNVALSVREADAQIQGAFGQVMPSVSLSSSYQRNLKSANPFAGSSAGNFFGSLGSIGWLAYNERSRTDDDPATVPITLDEFNRRQEQGLDDAGIVLSGSDNPFAVDNQFFNGLTVSQTLYDGRALVAIEAARSLKASTEAAMERQLQLVIHETRQAFFQALLAQENATVVAASIERTATTLVETQKRVAQGVASKFQRLSAEVELSNLETQFIQARNNAELASNTLKLTIGLPVDTPVRLDGSLESMVRAVGFFQAASLGDAVGMALAQRPDLQQAEIAVELQRLQREAEMTSYLPVVSAFANLNYTGRVPDNRSGYRTDPDDPFRFTPTQSGFFSTQYWNPDVAVGISLSWTLFDGFQRKSRIQQQQVGVDRRMLELEQLYESVRGEVDAALRSVRAAEQRIASQSENVERAEVNYQFAGSRLAEGVSSPLEERQASELLDQSRVAYLQAVHDYLIALSNYYTATGAPLRMSGESPRLTGK